MLKIYALDLSAPALKVLYVANYLGLDYERFSPSIQAGETQTPEYLKKHPAGKVPVIDDDGFILFESDAIVKYLIRKAQSNLYPTDLQQQAIVDQWTYFTILHIQNGVSRVLWNKVFAPKFGREVDENSLKCGYEFINRFFPIVEKQLSEHQYLAGNQLSLADFTLLANVDPVDLIGLDMTPYPSLSKWRDGLRTKDFYQKVHKYYGEAVFPRS